ncbi:MAG: hypothetical protein ACOVQX_00290 [Legionella sp.]
MNLRVNDMLPTILLVLFFGLFSSGILTYIGTQSREPFYSMVFLVRLLGGVSFLFFFFVIMKTGFNLISKLIVICVLALMPVTIYFLNYGFYIDKYSGNYILSISLVAIFFTIGRSICFRKIGKFYVTLLVWSSIICLLELCFYDELTIIKGRAAGLFSNPNIAAIVLIFSAIGSIDYIPKHLKIAFLILITSAVFSTLSVSGMLTWMVTLALLVLQNFNIKKIIKRIKTDSSYIAITLIAISMILSFAWNHNCFFPIAFRDSYFKIYTFKQEVLNVKTITPAAIKKMESNNSMAARYLLISRALSEYHKGPFWGRGLQYAFELAPHNSYILFSIAFGPIGLLIIPLFMIFIFILAGIRRGLPMAFSFLMCSFFSHDVLLNLSVVASFIFSLISLSFADNDNVASCGVDDLYQNKIIAILVTIISLCITNVINTTSKKIDSHAALRQEIHWLSKKNIGYIRPIDRFSMSSKRSSLVVDAVDPAKRVCFLFEHGLLAYLTIYPLFTIVLILWTMLWWFWACTSKPSRSN